MTKINTEKGVKFVERKNILIGRRGENIFKKVPTCNGIF